MKLRLIAGAIAVAALAGCYSYPGAIQDQSKPLLPSRYTVVGDEVSATEMQAFIFGIPLSDLRGSAGRRMYKSALSQAPGADALIEYTVDTKMINLNIIGFQWYTLTGVPVKTINK